MRRSLARTLATLVIVALGAAGLACSSSSSTSPSPSDDTGASVDTGALADAAPGGGDTGGPTGDAPAEAATGDTWESFAKGFFARYCVECHTTGGKRDYSQSGDVGRDATLIRCGVAPATLPGCPPFPGPKQFPIDDATKSNPKPTDAERARLVAWIDGGGK